MTGVDILIHDAHYTPEAYDRKRGWGDSCYIDTVNFAIEAEVGTLYLFHQGPNDDDEAANEVYQHYLESIKDQVSSLSCQLARGAGHKPLRVTDLSYTAAARHD